METEKHLAELEKGVVGNDILPFFWMHGESKEDLLEELEAVYRAGIRSICLESRTHEDFVGDGWWRDCDFLLQEAKKRGMTVWVLDDKHFPTGYANGLVTGKYPERRKWHLIESHVDVAGPSKGALMIEAAGANFEKKERKLFAVIACKRESYEEVMTGETVDLTACVEGDFLYWEVPEGCWRIFMLFQTREGSMIPGYIHMIDEESVDVLIEAVYEPHYRHYHEEFGKTFAGFFSDEPCFDNGAVDNFNTPLGWERWLGEPYQALPWRNDLLDRLTERLGANAKTLLPALWYDCGERTAEVRYAYLDIVTGLYRDCFNRRLGDWCREHGVRYIGHVIEELGLGMGAGHYFRSVAGQDMSGIDLIFQMIIPGLTEYRHTTWGSRHLADPEFNEYVLGKLGSSQAHIGQFTNGKAMCEIFGATGWAEGTPLMKHYIDHMLVRGINCFVPHAFTPRFPDPDCPPHFYAKGNNAQFRDFAQLMAYTAKMCHLFSGGVHRCTAALLYHVDARWCDVTTMHVKMPAKALYDAQIDYDIIPCDSLIQQGKVENGELVIQKEHYPCLVLPYLPRLPRKIIDTIAALAAQGLPVFAVQGTPHTLQGESVELPGVQVCSLSELPSFIRQKGLAQISLETPFAHLRFYHYTRDGAEYIMCFNEDSHAFDGKVFMPFRGAGIRLDLLNGSETRVEFSLQGTPLVLQPSESCVFAFGAKDTPPAEPPRHKVSEETIEEFTVSLCSAKEYPAFRFLRQGGLADITAPDCHPDFSGYIRYEAGFQASVADKVTLDLGKVGETAHVWVNGIKVGSRIAPPYIFDLTGAVQNGDNILCVEVANSMAYHMRDILSTQLLLPPSGLLGPVTVTGFE